MAPSLRELFFCREVKKLRECLLVGKVSLQIIVALLARSASHCSLICHLRMPPASATGSGGNLRLVRCNGAIIIHYSLAEGGFNIYYSFENPFALNES